MQREPAGCESLLHGRHEPFGLSAAVAVAVAAGLTESHFSPSPQG
jgi:hypothetical protein